jgi:hypothetical protein
LKVDLIFAVTLATIGVVITKLSVSASSLNGFLNTNGKNILSWATASDMALISATSCGFSIVSVLILDPKCHLIRKSRHYPLISRTFFSTLIWLGASVLTLVFYPSIHHTKSNSQVLFFTLFTLAVIGIVRFIRVAWITKAIMQIVHKKHKPVLGVSDFKFDV